VRARLTEGLRLPGPIVAIEPGQVDAAASWIPHRRVRASTGAGPGLVVSPVEMDRRIRAGRGSPDLHRKVRHIRNGPGANRPRMGWHQDVLGLVHSSGDPDPWRHALRASAPVRGEAEMDALAAGLVILNRPAMVSAAVRRWPGAPFANRVHSSSTGPPPWRGGGTRSAEGMAGGAGCTSHGGGADRQRPPPPWSAFCCS